MELFAFFWQLSFFTWLSGAIFFGIASVAIAIQLGLNIKLALVLGLAFQGLGIIALVVIHLVGRSKSYAKSANPLAVQKDDWAMAPGSGESQLGSASSMFSESTPYEFSTYESGYGSTKTKYWVAKFPGILIILGVVVVAISLVISLFMTWFNVVSDQNEIQAVNAISTGLDFWIFVSLAVLIASTLLSLRRPSIIAAVLVAWVGTWWLMLSMASLTARDIFVPAVDKIFQIPNLVIDANTRDGLFSSAYAFDIGPAWYVIFVCSLLLVSGSAWLLALSHSEKQEVSY